VNGLTDGSPFAGKVRVGAQIIAVGGTSCVDGTLAEVVGMLRETAGKRRAVRLSQRALPSMPPV